MHSFEVEKVEKIERNLEGVVVGEILELEKHSGADKLQVVKVNVGQKKLTIVCGAKNISVGDKVPVALPWTKLPNGLEIKEAEIRGVKSEGMLCAPDELGLGNDHSGILILDKKAKVGASFEKYFNLEDYVFDIDVLSNRGHDALSHVGMAREIAALEGKKIDYDYDGLVLQVKKSKQLKVEVKDKKLCPRYIGVVMKNVEVKESPLWLKARLMACGLRPINNVVDATNYVMLELGQPLHSFDFDKIKSEFPISNFQFPIKSQMSNVKCQSNYIIIRRAKKGEEIKLLDKTIKKLTSEDLVIANNEKVIALAGIMGGEDSGVTNDTKHIVLEAANFHASSIRMSRMRHGLKTDASDRFEKNIDPNLAEKAMVRVIELIQNIGEGLVEGMADVYPKKLKPWNLSLKLEYVRNLLGINISSSQIIKILRGLGLEATVKGNTLAVEVPTFRLDLTTQEELIEEIGRIYGYEKVQSVAPLIEVRASQAHEARAFSRKIKNLLAGAGFSEVYNYSFYSLRDAELAQLGAEEHVELSNPMNPEQALLRRSLVPNVLKNIRENLKNYKELQIFETGREYRPGKEVLPEERTVLLGAVVLEDNKNMFSEVRSYVELLLRNLHVDEFLFQKFDKDNLSNLWHKGRSAEIKAGDSHELIGYAGELHPMVLSNFSIRKRIGVFELDMEKLRKIEKTEMVYEPIRKFPIVTRDISMLVKNIPAADILNVIKEAGGVLVLDVELFDTFSKDSQTSFAFHIQFGAPDRTLTSGEVDELMERIIDGLEKLGVEVRK